MADEIHDRLEGPDAIGERARFCRSPEATRALIEQRRQRELKAGRWLIVMDTSGGRRKACLGRVKTEVRPLRPIDVEFDSGTRVNLILQDDWAGEHAFAERGKPLSEATRDKMADQWRRVKSAP